MTRARLLAVVAVACGGSPPAAPVGTRLGPALTAALHAADSIHDPWRCSAADGPELAGAPLETKGHTWKLAGHTLSLAGSGPVTIGVIADAGGSAPATVAALGRLRAQLAGADLVLALGGMGATQGELEATLGALTDRLVVAVPGDLEPVTAEAAAIAALRARGHAVVDGRLAHRIELPGVTIAVVPGAGAGARLAAGGDGCSYTATDVAVMLAELAGRPGLRIVASAESPRVTVGGEPAGELALTPGAGQAVDVSLHGPVTDAASPARSGGRDGAAVPLSPGTSDATTRLPGPHHAPSAGILTVTGATWRWTPIAEL